MLSFQLLSRQAKLIEVFIIPSIELRTVMALILDEEEGSAGDESALMEQQGNSGGINPHAPPFYPNNNNGALENNHMGDGDQDKENNINNLNHTARVRQVCSHKQTHLFEILFKALRSEMQWEFRSVRGLCTCKET